MKNPLEYAVLLGEPAYGRTYKTKEEMLADWEEGKDFRNVTPGVRGTYFSKRDATNADKVILSNQNDSIFLAITPE